MATLRSEINRLLTQYFIPVEDVIGYSQFSCCRPIDEEFDPEDFGVFTDECELVIYTKRWTFTQSEYDGKLQWNINCSMPNNLVQFNALK